MNKVYHVDTHSGEEGDPGSNRGYSIGLTVQSLKLFDLSHSGRHHPNVIWRNIPDSAPKVHTPTLLSAFARTTAPVPVPGPLPLSASDLTPMISVNLTLPGSKIKRPPVSPA